MTAKVVIKDHQANENGQAGVHIAAGSDVTIEGSTTSRNKGNGIVLGKPSGDPWYRRPIGIVLLAVTGGLILAWLKFQFGLSA